MHEQARDALNIVRDKQRREARSLHEYTGEDEDTKRTDVHVHVHQGSPSRPDIEVDGTIEVHGVKVTGVPKWVVVVVCGVVAACVALVARFAR